MRGPHLHCPHHIPGAASEPSVWRLLAGCHCSQAEGKDMLREPAKYTPYRSEAFSAKEDVCTRQIIFKGQRIPAGNMREAVYQHRAGHRQRHLSLLGMAFWLPMNRWNSRHRFQKSGGWKTDSSIHIVNMSSTFSDLPVWVLQWSDLLFLPEWHSPKV